MTTDSSSEVKLERQMEDGAAEMERVAASFVCAFGESCCPAYIERCVQPLLTFSRETRAEVARMRKEREDASREASDSESVA